jgi:hypothetical protein
MNLVAPSATAASGGGGGGGGPLSRSPFAKTPDVEGKEREDESKPLGSSSSSQQLPPSSRTPGVGVRTDSESIRKHYTQDKYAIDELLSILKEEGRIETEQEWRRVSQQRGIFCRCSCDAVVLNISSFSLRVMLIFLFDLILCAVPGVLLLCSGVSVRWRVRISIPFALCCSLCSKHTRSEALPAPMLSLLCGPPGLDSI